MGHVIRSCSQQSRSFYLKLNPQQIAIYNNDAILVVMCFRFSWVWRLCWISSLIWLFVDSIQVDILYAHSGSSWVHRQFDCDGFFSSIEYLYEAPLLRCSLGHLLLSTQRCCRSCVHLVQKHATKLLGHFTFLQIMSLYSTPVISVKKFAYHRNIVHAMQNGTLWHTAISNAGVACGEIFRHVLFTDVRILLSFLFPCSYSAKLKRALCENLGSLADDQVCNC